MRDTYSVYEAKAKLSAIVRRVREGHRIVVTHHGTPVAEIRPVETAAGGLEQRTSELADRGILVRPPARSARLQPVARRRGALARFLADREG